MNTNKAPVQTELLIKKAVGTLITFLLPILLVIFILTAIPFIRHEPQDFQTTFGNVIISDLAFACLNLSIITTIQCTSQRTYSNRVPASWRKVARFLTRVSVISIVVFTVFISTKSNLSLEKNDIIDNLILASDCVNKSVLFVSVVSILINAFLQTFIDVDSVLVSETKEGN